MQPNASSPVPTKTVTLQLTISSSEYAAPPASSASTGAELVGMLRGSGRPHCHAAMSSLLFRSCSKQDVALASGLRVQDCMQGLAAQLLTGTASSHFPTHDLPPPLQTFRAPATKAAQASLSSRKRLTVRRRLAAPATRLATSVRWPRYPARSGARSLPAAGAGASGAAAAKQSPCGAAAEV